MRRTLLLLLLTVLSPACANAQEAPASSQGAVAFTHVTVVPMDESFSLHRELTRMTAAGMSPYEILVSGTRAVGGYFANEDEFGTIAPGQRADLVLLSADPLRDVANLSRIEGVMARGRWHPKAEIEQRLAAIAASYR